jgi:hypothetical protein
MRMVRCAARMTWRYARRKPVRWRRNVGGAGAGRGGRATDGRVGFAAGADPVAAKAARHVVDDGSGDAAVHVVPADSAIFDGCVVVCDVEAAGEADLIVDDEDFAMVAVRKAEALAPRGDRVELDDLDARDAKVVDPRFGQAERADGVVDEAHGDAGFGALDEGDLETVARGVAREDVCLEADRALGGRDRVEHCSVGLAAVAEDRDFAAHAPADGGARVGAKRGGELDRDRA